MAEQLLGPPQSPADLDDDREVPTARVLDALRQLVNLGAAFLRDAAIVKEGLGQSFAQRDRARDLVGDERRLKTLSQLNLLGSYARFQHRTTPWWALLYEGSDDKRTKRTPLGLNRFDRRSMRRSNRPECQAAFRCRKLVYSAVSNSMYPPNDTGSPNGRICVAQKPPKPFLRSIQ